MKFQTVRGMRDYLPEEMVKKQFIEDTCRQVFELYGFLPWQTPVVEDFKLLSAKSAGGEEIRKEIYCFKDQSGRELGLRFDFTVPLGRVMASNPQLPRPFKRYCIGTVYRYDRPGKGRYREFTQADIDITGTGSMLAETECISATIEVFRRLGLKAKVRLNNRKLLEELALCNGVKKAQVVDCLRSLDKLEKIGVKGVREELKKKKIDSSILGWMNGKALGEIEKEFKEKKVNSKGLKEVKELLEYLKAAGLEKQAEFDLSIARGLEYYTGTVFEVKVGEGQSVGGGGRYDKLIELYGGRPEEAVGISYGVERICGLMGEKLALKPKKGIYLVPIGEKTALKALEMLQRIRSRAGVPAELDLKAGSVGKSLEFALKQGFPFVAFIGEKELEKSVLTVKDMEKRKEFEVKFSELEKLKEIVGAGK